MKQTVLFLLTLLATSFSIVLAQPICQIKEYSNNDGLLQNILSGIIQDQKGFLWISTRNGINKFDGYTFKCYKSSPHKEFSLSNNRITFIAETKQGDIWCQTYDKRAYIFDTYKETFYDVLQPIDEAVKRKSSVKRIYPLKKGIAWIVCSKGDCYRVDEQRYKEKEGITLHNTFNGALKGNDILDVFQDSDGDEWVLTNRGISIIGSKKIGSDFPFKRIMEHQGKIYLISTSEKLAYYDPHTESIKFIETPPDINQINTFTTLSNGKLALSTNIGAVLYDPEKSSCEVIDIHGLTPSVEVRFIYEDRLGELWIISTSPGVTRVNLATGEKQQLYTPKEKVVHYERNNLTTFFEDSQGTLWLTPVKGNFSYYDRASKQLKGFYTDPADPQSLFAPLVRIHYLDKQGNAWLTGARGIQKMSFYPQVYNLKPIDPGFEIRAFHVDRSKRLWVASNTGTVRIYNADGSLSGYLSPQGTISQTKTQFPANIYCFNEGKDGVIWMGTKGNGLYQLTKTGSSYTVRNYTYQNNNLYSLSNNDIYTVFTDSKDNVWIGCYGGGLNLLTHSTKGEVQFINHRNKLKNFPINDSHNIRYITETEGGTVLVGTTYGLITFSSTFDLPEEIKFYRNIQRTNDATSLTANDIMHIYTSSTKETYVAAFSGGINKVLSKNLLTDRIAFKSYTESEGLSSDLVFSMVEDADRNLWIVSENALSKFNSKAETFENYDTKFLRQQLNFSETVPTINGSNQLVFGTDMGVLEIVPEQMKRSSYIPAIVLRELKINGRHSITSVDNLEKIVLNPSERNISISFSALDYVRPEDIRYAYQLQGLEDEWNYNDKNRSANYINLPVGDYLLHIKSTNSDGVWVNNVRTLSIKVLPTFWETPWAWIIYVFLFILFTTVIAYVLIYIYQLRHQVETEHQMANIKLKFFTDISHELRTPLTLISTPVTEVLENEPLTTTAREHLTMVRRNTERMLRLVNQILDFRKIQNKKMKILIERTELIAFLLTIIESFKLVADENLINYTLTSQQDELFIWIDRDKVEKIVFNLLSNAFKYTSPGKSIKVIVKTDSQSVSIHVIDEGIGIARDKQESLFQRFETLPKDNMLHPSSGIGLSLVKELAEMHHGSIAVKSKVGVGSDFCVKLPLNKEAFEGDNQVEIILTDYLEKDVAQSSKREAAADRELTIRHLPCQEEEEERTILIVEDNLELRSLLRTILASKYNIIEASNGEEGLKEAIQLIPDMIISDVMMPTMDGLEMVKLIKGNKNICHIPIVLLSAKSSLDDRIEGIEQGIDDYITKPFSSTYLKARIASLFNQRALLQEAFLNKLGNNKSELSNWMPAQPQVQPHDELFMQQIMEFMEQQMDNPELTIDDFADKVLLSRSMFYRKLKAIVGLTPVDFIREIRLKRATQLIESSSYNFSQIAYMTGFSDPKYFSKCFKKHAGTTPREYKEKFMQQRDEEAGICHS